MARHVYLQMKSLAEARRLLMSRFQWDEFLDTEMVPVGDAVGRVLAEPVFAALSSPGYHGAAMDGIALWARDTFGASDDSPLDLLVGQKAFFVNTGEVLPKGTDAVIMIEQVQVIDDDLVRIEAPAFPWQHVRRVGEDIVATEMLFARGHLVTPTCAGALLAGGVLSVPVRRRPRVLIIPTGGELVDPKNLTELQPGKIIEFNSTILGKLVEAHGGEFQRQHLPDDLEHISSTIVAAVEGDFDLVLVIGGSSAGTRDFTKTAIEGVGEVFVHGVTAMPGKPTVLGTVSQRPVVGVPGYPVSAIVCFEQFVAPVLARMLGVAEVERQKATAIPTKKIASKLGMEEFVRVRMGYVGDKLVATPLPRGAGTVTSFTMADGLIRIPSDLEGLHAFEPVEVELLRPLSQIEHNLVAVGSHDLCLDILADLLKKRQNNVTLGSTHVGSLGGLMAIRHGTCHLAGSHLLDADDGSYNTSFVKRYLAEVPVRIVHLVRRNQGLMVAPGNPKNIEGFADLLREEVTFVNRQGGSGTRVLLDYELDRRSMDSSGIIGYETIEFTHMAVAVAVLSGAADVGLGIRAAARALGLEFIDVVYENYELVIPEEFFDSTPIETLLEIINSAEFAKRVMKLGGYDTSLTGQTRSIP